MDAECKHRQCSKDESRLVDNTGMLNATVTMQEGQMQVQATQMNANTDECRLSYEKTGWLKQDRGN